MSVSEQPLVIALSRVLEDAAQRAGIPAEEVVVIRVEAARWPDSCLGLGRAGEACTDAITKGYRIRLRGGTTYRTDLHGTIRRELRSIPRPQDGAVDDEIRLLYSEAGGLTGGRNELETDSTRLTSAEVRELRSLLAESDFFSAPIGQASAAADGITRRLWVAVGRRGREIIRGDGVDIKDPPALEALLSWVQERMIT